MVPAFEYLDGILRYNHVQAVESKSCVLFIMLYKVVLTSESVDDILKCDHSNESY